MGENDKKSSDKKRRIFQLRDILFLLAFLLHNGWIMALAFTGFLVSVILQMRDDWKKYHKFDLFTVVYAVIALAIFALLAYSAFFSIKQNQ
jgi:D-alanyl-lipoteichoic acid acyltransferase DltB (MBOAT superfamily)